MSLYNTHQRYGSFNKFLHWLIFVLLVFMLILGYFLGDIPNAYKGTVYNIHKLTGIAILVIMLIRLIWVILNGKPRLPATVHPLQRLASRAVHWLMYLCILAMPLAGWIMSTAANKLPKIFGMTLAFPFIPVSKTIASTAWKFHEVLSVVIVILIVIHTLAALKHQWIDKDGVLKRMLPGG